MSGARLNGKRETGHGTRLLYGWDWVSYGIGAKRRQPRPSKSERDTAHTKASAISYDALRLLSNERRSKHSCGSAAVMGSDSHGASCCGRWVSGSLPRPSAAATDAGVASSSWRCIILIGTYVFAVWP